MRVLLSLRSAGAAVLLAAAGAGPVLAQQTAPSTEQMIDQLRPAPRTRGMTRNFLVEPAVGERESAAAAAAPASARPSLSLQVQFAFDSVEVMPQSQQSLQHLAMALKSRDLSASRFAIEGHTDAKGRRDYNVRLSQRRADAVRDLLARQGVEPSRLTSLGKGPDEPADPVDPYAAVNRRVRIVNLD